MRGKRISTVLKVFLLNLAVGTAFAGGRYADPPPNLVEVQQLSVQALEAAKQGDKDATLAAANKARKMAIDSYKEKSTMPMQNSSSRLKTVVNSLEGGAVRRTRSHCCRRPSIY